MQRFPAGPYLQETFYFGALLGQRRKILPVQAQHFHGGAAPHAGHARASAEQARLAKLVAGVQHVDGKFLAGVVGLANDPRPAQGQEVEGIGLFSFTDDQIPKIVVFFPEQSPQLLVMLRRQEFQQRRTPQEFLGFGFHPARASFKDQRIIFASRSEKQESRICRSTRSRTLESSRLGSVLLTIR